MGNQKSFPPDLQPLGPDRGWKIITLSRTQEKMCNDIHKVLQSIIFSHLSVKLEDPNMSSKKWKIMCNVTSQSTSAAAYEYINWWILAVTTELSQQTSTLAQSSTKPNQVVCLPHGYGLVSRSFSAPHFPLFASHVWFNLTIIWTAVLWQIYCL